MSLPKEIQCPVLPSCHNEKLLKNLTGRGNYKDV